MLDRSLVLLWLVARAFKLVVSSRNLRLFRGLRKLADVVEEVVVEALARRRALFRIDLQHELEQVFEHAVLLAPLVVDDVVEE